MLPRATLSRIVCPSACALLVLAPASTQAQPSPDLSGKWALNRALSQFPSELGFDANFHSMAVDDQEAAERGGRGRRPPSRMPLPESADEGARKQQLTDEVRDPAPNLTITDTPDAVTFADDRGRSRTFHPNGKEELIQLGGVGVVTIARREAGELVVLYEVAQGRQIRYAFSRLDDPARLIVETQFIDRGNADKVTRLYEPAKAAAPSTSGAQTSSSGSPPPPAGTPPPASSVPGPGAEFRGLSEIGVVVEELTSQSTSCALNQSTLETAVFKHLTDAGLKPRRNSDEDTYVYVNISTATVSNGLCVSRYDVYLTTHTMAKLSYQESPVLVEVTLVHKGSMAGGQAQAHADNVMKGVLDDVDEIASRIREANR
jgi:hypothetical protein